MFCIFQNLLSFDRKLIMQQLYCVSFRGKYFLFKNSFLLFFLRCPFVWRENYVEWQYHNKVIDTDSITSSTNSSNIAPNKTIFSWGKYIQILTIFVKTVSWIELSKQNWECGASFSADILGISDWPETLPEFMVFGYYKTGQILVKSKAIFFSRPIFQIRNISTKLGKIEFLSRNQFVSRLGWKFCADHRLHTFKPHNTAPYHWAGCYHCHCVI